MIEVLPLVAPLEKEDKMSEALEMIGIVFVIMTIAAIFLKGYSLADTLILGYIFFAVFFFFIAAWPANGFVCLLMALTIWVARRLLWAYQDKRGATVERVT